MRFVVLCFMSLLVAQPVEAQWPMSSLMRYLSAKSGPRFVLKDAVNLKVAVPTTVGVINAKLKVLSIDLRGPEGWNKFVFRLKLDPSSFSSGDSLRDKFVIEAMLKPQDGEMYFYALERIAPNESLQAGKKALPRAKGWLDPTRKGAYLEIPYQWEKNNEGGTFSFSHQTELKSVGIRGSKHPFVQITGPVTVSLTAKMIRASSNK